MSVNLSPKIASNGFSYAPIESAREQRIKRVLHQLESKGSLTTGEVLKIANYTRHNTALELMISLFQNNYYKRTFCLEPLPKSLEKTFRDEIKNGT